jgi:hypothetical protein
MQSHPVAVEPPVLPLPELHLIIARPAFDSSVHIPYCALELHCGPLIVPGWPPLCCFVPSGPHHTQSPLEHQRCLYEPPSAASGSLDILGSLLKKYELPPQHILPSL